MWRGTLSKAVALLLIGVHEVIDYFSGVDKEFFAGGWGENNMVFCHRMLAVVKKKILLLLLLLLFLRTGQITIRDGSEFYIPYLLHYIIVVGKNLGFEEVGEGIPGLHLQARTQGV